LFNLQQQVKNFHVTSSRHFVQCQYHRDLTTPARFKLISLELDDFVAGLVFTEDAMLLDVGDVEGSLRE